MKLFLVVLGVHLLVLASHGNKVEKTEKEVVMVEIDPTDPDDRPKRAHPQGDLKVLRQPSEVSPEYIQFLQQLSQRDQAVAAQQPQYIQQVVLPKDGRRAQAPPPPPPPQQPPTRYILADGRLLEEDPYLTQQPQQFAAPPPPPPQYAFQSAPPQLGRPVLSPELAALSRQQQRLQQDYADAPLRAQIAGGTSRARQRPVPGPNSQSPQVFAQSQPRGEARLRAQVQSDGQDIVYTPVPADAQAIIQQQLAHLGIAGGDDGRQFYTQSRPVIPQQIIYQQSGQDDFTQERVVYQQQQPQFQPRRPVTQTSQPQTLSQDLPQQYLIETSRPQSQQSASHYVPQEVTQQVQYVPQSQVLAQQAAAAQGAKQQQQYQSTLLQPVNSRGLYDPKPSRSSIFVSRASSTPRPVPINSGEATSQKVPIVRIPSPINQRTLTRQELDAIVSAGYTLQPVPIPVPVLVPDSGNYLKSKRQQPVPFEERKNHVAYENRQDGVQYQYSPGSSQVKVKKSVAATSAVEAEPKRTEKVAVAEEGDAETELAYYESTE